MVHLHVPHRPLLVGISDGKPRRLGISASMKVYSESGWRRQSQLIEEGDRLKGLLGSLRSAATDHAECEPHDITDDEAALQADAIETRLVAVVAALDRIEAGEYGLCRVCGSGIAEERLDAVPATDMCRACA